MLSDLLQIKKPSKSKLLLNSLIEEAILDQEELRIAYEMFNNLENENLAQMKKQRDVIFKLHHDSKRKFEDIYYRIHQTKIEDIKKFELLKLHQNICDRSKLTMNICEYLILLAQFKCPESKSFTSKIKKNKEALVNMHEFFLEALKNESHKKSIDKIRKIIEIHENINKNNIYITREIYKTTHKNITYQELRVVELILDAIEKINNSIIKGSVILECLIMIDF